MDQASDTDYKQRVLPIMRMTRSVLLPQWGVAEIAGIKQNEARNIVTALDIEVERMLKDALLKQYPDIGFVGEESGGNREGRHWLVDPIDGTQAFVRGLPFCTSMLALIDSGEVVFSVIYDFLNDKMYWAEKGKGAFCNDTPIRVSTRTLSESFVAWESNQAKPENRELSWRLRQRAGVFMVLCAGWEYVMVASGKLDARICYEPYGNDYDFAPGALLVKEAGGIVSNIGSSEFDHQDLNSIAANPIVYKELTEGVGAVFPVTK